MAAMLLFTLLAIAALGASLTWRAPRAARLALVAMAPCLLVIGVLIGSSVVIAADKSGVIMRQFGAAMPTGQIVARAGEQGPQAAILGPGWHFGYIPFLYQIDEVDVMVIEHGKLGFVTAKDGAAMPPGETFATFNGSATDLIDPEKFLANGGQRGPQTTVLGPGTYRYNPKLHDIQLIPVLTVAPGTVAVITSNVGPLPPTSGDGVVLVNGVPLVGKDLRGIWKEPLTPRDHFLNRHAFRPTVVKTTQRVYTYQEAHGRKPSAGAKASDPVAGSWAVTVRSKDGFSLPIDVRVACAVEAKDAPYLVALLGDPDKLSKDEQEDEMLETLEAKVILPTVRAVLRNVAETMNALEFVNARSQVQQVATERMKAELAKVHVTVDGIFIGNIHADANEAMRRLVATQTDRQVALNEQALYGEKKRAEEARATFIKAQEEAEQQRNLAKATYQVQVKEQEAKARAAEAKGEADFQMITGEGRARAYDAMVKSLGREQVAQLELLKLVSEGKVQITPQVMVTGGAGVVDALGGTLLRQATAPAAPAK